MSATRGQVFHDQQKAEGWSGDGRLQSPEPGDPLAPKDSSSCAPMAVDGSQDEACASDGRRSGGELGESYHRRGGKARWVPGSRTGPRC